MDILENATVLNFHNCFDNAEIWEYDPKGNIFYSKDKKGARRFLLKVACEKLRTSKLQHFWDITREPNQFLLNFVNIVKLNQKYNYLSFEFSEIRLIDYIQYSKPELRTRLSLLKQLTELIIYIKRKEISLHNLDVNYIFVENLENPMLKLLCHCNFVLIYYSWI